MCIRYSALRILWTLEKAMLNNREGRMGRHSVIKWNNCGAEYWLRVAVKNSQAI